MQQAKPILILLGKFFLAFALFSAIFNYVLKKPYTHLLGKHIAVFNEGAFGKNGTIDVQLPGVENKKNDDIRIFLLDEDMKNEYRQAVAKYGQNKVAPFKPPLIAVKVWIQAGLYLVFFIALVLATAFDWKQALIALGVGLVILHVFIVWKTGVRISFETYNNGIGGETYSSIGKSLLIFFNNLLRLISSNLFIVIILWLLLAFKSNDYSKFVERLMPQK